MVRPPCCDKEGVKKGPWTPEEDIMLVSYVQEHGPGNWRAVPTNTGLRRCSKSCRLRWTNYLRPGIKRGSFTDHEEKLIIQLQALLGNKWAAIASYLPERTDNDVKNYWNTHLKKKLKKLHESSPAYHHHGHGHSRVWLSSTPQQPQSISRGQWEKRLQTDINKAKQALHEALSLDQKPTNKVCCSYSSAYASSTENIARLLKGWMMKKNSPTKASQTNFSSTESNDQTNSFDNNNMTDSAYSEGALSASKNIGTTGIDLSDQSLESFFCLDTDFSQSVSHDTNLLDQGHDDERKPDLHDAHQVPLMPMFENNSWFFDEDAEEGKEDLTNFSFDENEGLF